MTRLGLSNCPLLKRILACAGACQRFLKNNAVAVRPLATQPRFASFGFSVPPLCPRWYGGPSGDRSRPPAAKDFFTNLTVNLHTHTQFVNCFLRVRPGFHVWLQTSTMNQIAAPRARGVKASEVSTGVYG